MKKLFFTIAAIILSAAVYAQPQYLKHVAPALAGMDAAKLARVDTIMNQAVKEKDIPGGVVAIVRGDKIVYMKAFGHKSVYPTVTPMTANTVFDLASCSKSVSTAICIMQLMEKGYLKLNDNVDRFIPGYQPYVDPATGEKIEEFAKDKLGGILGK